MRSVSATGAVGCTTGSSQEPRRAATTASTTNRCSRRVLLGTGELVGAHAGSGHRPGGDVGARAPHEQLRARTDEPAVGVHDAAGLGWRRVLRARRRDRTGGRLDDDLAREHDLLGRARVDEREHRGDLGGPVVGVGDLRDAEGGGGPVRRGTPLVAAAAAGSTIVRQTCPSASRCDDPGGNDHAPGPVERQRAESPRSDAGGRVGRLDRRAASSTARRAGRRSSPTPAVTNPVGPSSHAPPSASRWSRRSAVSGSCSVRAPRRRTGGERVGWRHARVPVISCAAPGAERAVRDVGEPGAARPGRGAAAGAGGTRSTPGGTRTRCAVGDEPADERHDVAEPEAVHRAGGRARRLGHVEERDAAAGPQHARALGEHRREVDEVAQREAAREPVERAVGERQPGRVGAHERGRRCGPRRACRPRSRRRSAGSPRRPSVRHRSPVPHARSSTRAPAGEPKRVARRSAASPRPCGT